jgi:biotin carboxyl carrier protein
MEYNIIIDEDIRTVEISSSDSTSSDEFVASMKSGKRGKIKLCVLKRDRNRIVLLVGNKVFSVIQTERTPSFVEFIANGQTVRSRIDERSEKVDSSSLIATASELISSNFPAKVVKLAVKKGDRMKEGETLVILEAMKMEAQIKTPHDCTVEEVFIHEGEMVAKGKRMIKLKFG